MAAGDPGTGGAAVIMPDDLNTLNMTNLAIIGGVIANNFVTVHKILDVDYIENHRQVSLVQALGAREVQGRLNPGGPYKVTADGSVIPNMGPVAAGFSADQLKALKAALAAA